MSEQISKAMLDPFLNEQFEIKSVSGKRLELKLIESKDKSKNENELFWFIFEGPVDQPLPQQTYILHHPELGELTMFLVPVAGKNKERLNYQALFNRITPGR